MNNILNCFILQYQGSSQGMTHKKWWCNVFYPTSSCQSSLFEYFMQTSMFWVEFFGDFCQLEKTYYGWWGRNPKQPHVKNPVNHGRFSISTGERRISEPSTVPNFSNFLWDFRLDILGHHTSIRPVPQPWAAALTGPAGPGAIYHETPTTHGKIWGFGHQKGQVNTHN